MISLPTASPVELPLEASLGTTYQWLLILGFPATVAAASLMPQLFTDEIRPPEARPGSDAHLPVVATSRDP